MLRRLGLWLVVLAWIGSASAAERPGAITGMVRSSSGTPQMGAVVEILGSASTALRGFTNDRGVYSVAGLLPGVYTVKVSAPSFLPVLREKIALRAGATAVVNVTLSSLFEAIQLAPVRSPADDDDWKWVLRSVSNRPILRVLDDKTLAQVAQGDNKDLKGSLSFVAGSESDGFGSDADMSTGFTLEKSIFATDTLAFGGNVAYNSGTPNAVLRTSFKHKLPNGSEPQVALTVRRLASPDPNLHSLQALALSTSDDFTLGRVLELKFGSELQTIQFMGRMTAFRPFGSAGVHISPNTVLEYSYTTSLPDARGEKGFETAPADLSESGPRMSIANFSPALERAHHQEISLSRRLGKTNLQFAAYLDQVSDPALTGVGAIGADSGEVLPDVYSGTFTYQGADLSTRGLRLVVQRKLTSDLTATLDYGYGGALDLVKSDVSLQDVRSFTGLHDRHTASMKLSGTLPRTHTHWITSYRWTGGQTLTPVDWFNASAGQSDPYLNLFIRQPIPGIGFLPGHIEALIDMRNLLAQGYVPVMGQDGRTVYLVQSARAIRGGVTFSF